jgi:hypothetical protein
MMTPTTSIGTPVPNGHTYKIKGLHEPIWDVGGRRICVD